MPSVRAVAFDYGDTLGDLRVAEPQLLEAYGEIRQLLESQAHKDIPQAADLIQQVTVKVIGTVNALEGVLRAEARESVLRVYSERGGRIISGLIQIVEDAGLHVRNIGLTEPSLETLFVSLTGRKLD